MTSEVQSLNVGRKMREGPRSGCFALPASWRRSGGKSTCAAGPALERSMPPGASHENRGVSPAVLVPPSVARLSSSNDGATASSPPIFREQQSEGTTKVRNAWLRLCLSHAQRQVRRVPLEGVACPDEPLLARRRRPARVVKCRTTLESSQTCPPRNKTPLKTPLKIIPRRKYTTPTPQTPIKYPPPTKSARDLDNFPRSVSL